jgi:membrane-associated phospholipid phosphatase
MTEHAFRAAGIPAGRARAGDRAPSVAAALAVAGACFAALVLVWALVNHVTAVQWKDAVALHDFTQLSRPSIDGVASFLLHLLDPTQFVLWGVALVAVAFARERPRVAVAVIVVMALAPFTSETLKPLLAHPHIEIGHDRIGSASWPSGHSTAALALVLSAVLVAPARLRVIVALAGAAFALAVGCSLLILAWHMPSDVLGGYLVASCWAALAVAALRLAERRWPTCKAF